MIPCRHSTIVWSVPAALLAVFSVSAIAADDKRVEKNQSIEQIGAIVERSGNAKEWITDLAPHVRGRRLTFDVTIEPNSEQTPWLILINLSDADLARREQEYAAQGYVQSVHKSYSYARQRAHAVVWRLDGGAAKPLTLPDLPLPETGWTDEAVASLDLLMRAFLKENNVAGASLAVSVDGRIVYARGFGWQDIDPPVPVQPGTRFRIASVSKPITAIAIMKLVESGDLSLDETVVPILKSGPFKRWPRSGDPRWDLISVRHLLQHTGGWDSEVSGDPMFKTTMITRELKLRRMAGAADTVQYMLSQRLDFDPGEKYAYSNFGYCLLGRIIEIKSGRTYEDFVKEQILDPSGAVSTTIGRELLEERLPTETRYFTQHGRTAPSVRSLALANQRSTVAPQTVPEQYGAFTLSAMDANGGWVSTAPDLLRILGHLEHGDQPLLAPQTRDVMFAAGTHHDAAKQDYHYACGWLVRSAGRADKLNAWHNGSIAGTSSLLVRRHDGWSWAILFNTDKTTDDRYCADAIDEPLHTAISQILRIPKHNFSQESGNN